MPPEREGVRHPLPRLRAGTEDLAGCAPEAGPAPFDSKMTEAQVTLEGGGEFINFLTDTGATYSVLVQQSWSYLSF